MTIVQAIPQQGVIANITFARFALLALVCV